jgi:hypothetical protein
VVVLVDSGSLVRRGGSVRIMADNRDPPPLFNNVDIDQHDYDNEDLFSSAVQVVTFNLTLFLLLIFFISSFHSKFTDVLYFKCNM